MEFALGFQEGTHGHALHEDSDHGTEDVACVCVLLVLY